MIVLIALVLSFIVLILILLWIAVPALFGLPVVPSRPSRVRAALKLAQLQPEETLYDLGAGDGRVLLIAAREFGAKAVGIEVGPMQCAWIRLRVTAAGLGDRIRVRWGDFYKANLGAADVVYIYATSREVVKLAAHLEAQLRPGARVIAVSADFPEWEPVAFEERELVFLYEMPPGRGNLTSFLLKRSHE